MAAGGRDHAAKVAPVDALVACGRVVGMEEDARQVRCGEQCDHAKHRVLWGGSEQAKLFWPSCSLLQERSR